MNYKLLVILIAYLLDLFIGDPQWRWHPVRLIGRLIERLERGLNKDSINKRVAGFVLVILVVGFTVFCVWAALKLAESIHPIIYYLALTMFIYFAISVKALGIEASRVYNSLTNREIKKARKNLSMIVARDTGGLKQPEIIRATVETVAESIMDGIVAPLFYVFLGGPVLVWAYKAINTLDSMVGYRSERFIEFGRASAKLDGLANLIPARITCLLISASSWCYRKDWSASLKWGRRYLFKGTDYNSEATEAAMAAALGVQLGGLNFYDAVPIPKPCVGDSLYPLDARHIEECIKISYLCSALALIFGIFLTAMIGRG